MKLRIHFIRENIALFGIIALSIIYFSAITYFSFKVELFILFSAITRNRFFLISLFTLLFIMFLVVLYKFVQIFTDRIRNREGSRFRFRLTLFFLIIAGIPILPLTIISNNLISKSINLWFVSGIEESLVDAVGVSKELYSKLSEEAAEEWRNLCGDCPPELLKNISFTSIDGVFLLQREEGEIIGYYAKDRSIMLDIESLVLSELKIENWRRVVAQEREYLLTPAAQLPLGTIILVREIPGYLTDYTRGVSAGLQTYRTVKILREPIKGVVVLFYVVVTMPFVLLSFYLSLVMSKDVTVPIKELAIATQKVAHDELDYQIYVNAKDELKLLVDSFNRMMEELRRNRELLKHSERSAAWRDMARIIAHEIKNPLTPIKLSAERILRHYAKDTQYSDILEKGIKTIISEVDTINDMVNAFSQFARFPVAKRTRLDVIPLMHDITAFLQDSYKNLSFSFHHKEKSVYLLVDGNLLRRALLNVIYNSINALPNGGEIRIECAPSEGKKDHITIAISDNGTGIDESIRERIFDPYFSHNGKGTGLGLVIVERIVLDNEGRIWFESEPGHTTFYMEFVKA